MTKLHIMGGLECIRVFGDHPESSPPFVGHKHIEYGSREWHRTVKRSQDAGAGVFFSVNGTDGKGARSYNINRVRTYYVDVDALEDKGPTLERMITAPLKPSAIVETKNGVHAYWYAKHQTPVDHAGYQRVQKGLIKYFGGDKSVKDIARVLRVPGTYHLKDPEHPFLVRIVHQLSEEQTPYYTPDELLASYPAPVEAPLPPVRIEKLPGAWGKVLEDLERWDPVPGERNHVMLLCAGVAISYGVDQNEFVDTMYPIASTWNTGRNVLGELRRVARWAYERGNPIPAFVLRKKGVPIRRGL